MRVLFCYCDHFAWEPALKTLENAPQAEAAEYQQAIVAFIHVEPKDIQEGSTAGKKLLKNIKWLAKKWQSETESVTIILHSFTHLGEQKASPEQALKLINKVEERLKAVEYPVRQTPYGYFLDLNIQAKGHPLARIYKEF